MTTGTAALSEIDVGMLEGIASPKPLELPATRYLQGERTMYSIQITLAQLTQLITKRPDPDHPIEGNRKVDANRARKFGKYVLDREDWVSPAIIVRAPSGEISFKDTYVFPNNTAWGILSIPLHVLTEIVLLDGQHRTLGTFMALDEINAAISTARDTVEHAKKNGNDDVAAEASRTLSRKLDQRKRLTTEHISVDFAVVSTHSANQMFVDIADNAKGVNPDFTTILDQKEVVNRIAATLIAEHRLLKDRIELGQSTRMSKTNPHLMGAKSVADIVRAVHVGVTGRMGARKEDELEKDIVGAVDKVATFLDITYGSFDELQLIVEDAIEPRELREPSSQYRSMIGSATMLRVLAGTYFELTKPPVNPGDAKPMGRAKIEQFFTKLAVKMRNVPVAEKDRFWMSTNAFIPETMAPQARQGTMRSLVDQFVDWARNGNSKLD